MGDAAATSVTSAVVLFVASQSPPPVTAALFVTEGTAPVAGVTVNVMLFAKGLAAGTDAVVVQVTIWPTAAHVHVAPVADTKANPGGSVSVTVIGVVLAMP